MIPLRFSGVRVPLLLGSVLLAGVAVPCGAQRIELGTRVRVQYTVPEGGPERRVSGSLVGQQGDTLLFQLSRREPPLRVTVASLRALEVSSGKGTEVRRATLAGGLAGAVLFGLISYVDAERCEPSPEFGGCPSKRTELLLGAVLGAGGGMVLGRAIGVHTAQERWTPVPLGVSPPSAAGEVPP